MDETVYKFSFLSMAQIYSQTLEYPVSIVMGSDQFYWVVTDDTARRLASQGYHVLNPGKLGARRLYQDPSW